MTTVRLHGILAKEFGAEMCYKIRRPKEIFNAIDANKPNFIKRVMDLFKEGIHYSIVVDGEDIKEIHELNVTKEPDCIDIIPAIMGSGKVGGAILTIVGAALMFVNVGLGAAVMGIGLQMMLAPRPKPEQRPEAVVSGLQDSFVFSSKANLAQQGIPVPVGYGRLRVGSAIIQSTIKSFPQKYKPNLAMEENPQSLNQTTQAINLSYTDNL